MEKYDGDDPIVQILLALFCAGMVASLFVMLSLLRFGTMQSSFTYLLFLLELSLLGEQIAAIPFAFSGSPSFCTFVSFCSSYFGLMNVVVVALLITAHRLTLFTNTLRVRRLIVKYSRELALCAPLVTLLPFASDAYEHHQLPWCLPRPTDERNEWMIAGFFLWVGLLLLTSFVNLLAMIVRVFWLAPKMLWKFFSSIGLCALVSLFSWVPRFISLANGSINVRYILTPIFVQSILIGLIFLYERKSFENNERSYSTNKNVVEFGRASSFSWEAGEFLDELIAMGEISSEHGRSTRASARPSDASYSSRSTTDNNNKNNCENEQEMVVVENVLLKKSAENTLDSHARVAEKT